MALYTDDDDEAEFEDAREHDMEPVLQAEQVMMSSTAPESDDAWSAQDRAILREFNHVRELQLALFSRHMALETTFRKIEPEHDFDKRSTFCEHLPEAFREKAQESEAVMTALTGVTSAMAALSAQLLASEPPLAEDDMDNVIFDYDLPSAADAGFEEAPPSAGWTPGDVGASGGLRASGTSRRAPASAAASSATLHASDATRVRVPLAHAASFIDHGTTGGAASARTVATAAAPAAGVRNANGAPVSPPPRPARGPAGAPSTTTRAPPAAPKR